MPGDRVWIKGRGQKQIIGVIIDVQPKHCNIRCDQDQGTSSGAKKRTEKTKINKLPSVGLFAAAEESAAESDVTLPCPGDGEARGSGDGGPAAAAEEPAPAPAAERPAPAAMDAEAAKEAAAAAKWGDASDVFGGF